MFVNYPSYRSPQITLPMQLHKDLSAKLKVLGGRDRRKTLDIQSNPLRFFGVFGMEPWGSSHTKPQQDGNGCLGFGSPLMNEYHLDLPPHPIL